MPLSLRVSEKTSAWTAFLLVAAAMLPSAGCPMLLASGVYLWEGGNYVDADYEGLKQHSVVVFCRPPASSGFSHAGAARDISERVSRMLEQEVPKIKMVSQQEVEKWIDENDSDDFKALGRAVKADLVVHIELDHFDIYNGPTLYQGASDVTISVHDMKDGGRLLWDRKMGEFRYPSNSGVPVQEKSDREFRRQYIEVLAGHISRHFYRHDPHIAFAEDATAIR